MSERETSDEELEGLASNLTVDAGDAGLETADPGVESLVSAGVAARAGAGARAAVTAVATNVDSLWPGEKSWVRSN